MQDHSLIRSRNPEHTAHLLGLPLFDITEGDDLPLAVRQRVDRLLNPRLAFPSQQPFFWRLPPALRRRRPVVRPLGMIGSEEAARIDRRFRGLPRRVRERREWKAAPLALDSRLAPVHEDAKDPGLERAPPFEPVDPFEHSQSRVLDDLLGGRAG